MSARAELSLRQRLSQREDRISELKDALASAKEQHPGAHSAPLPARSHSPRPGSTTIPDQRYQNHMKSYSRTDAKSPRDRSYHSYAQRQRPSSGLGQDHALGPEDADEDEQARHGQLHRRSVQPPQSRVSDEQSHEQHGGAAHRAALKLPYFQPKSHASAEPAVTSLAPSQQAAAQQTEFAHASQDPTSKCLTELDAEQIACILLVCAVQMVVLDKHPSAHSVVVVTEC